MRSPRPSRASGRTAGRRGRCSAAGSRTTTSRSRARTACVVLRVAGKDTDLLGIDRTVELAATRAAAEVGRRAGGRRLRRARGLARHALRRRIDPAAGDAARARAAPSRRAGAPGLPPGAADPGTVRRARGRRGVSGHGRRARRGRSRRVRLGTRAGTADRRVARRPAASCRATTTCSTRTSSTTASGS